MEKLIDAIENFQQANFRVGSDRSRRQTWLRSLASIYKEIYDRTEPFQHSQEAISVCQEVVDKTDASSIDILMALCHIKCHRTQAIQGIDQAISSG